MVSRNNITGDRLINKRLSKEGEDNWDKIFKKQGIILTEEELANVEIIADIVQHHHNNKTIPKEDPVKKPFPHNILKQPCDNKLRYVLDDGQLTDEQYAKIKQQLSEYELDKSTGEVIKKDNP